MVRTVSQWANGCLEREGLARLTISILVITTAGCLAYTWGYAEGVHNTKTVIVTSKPAATPVLFPGAEVHGSAAPTVAAAAGTTDVHLSTDAAFLRQRVHRRRSRKSPEDQPAMPPDEPEPQQQEQQQAATDTQGADSQQPQGRRLLQQGTDPS